jgi:hypothetical protein
MASVGLRKPILGFTKPFHHSSRCGGPVEKAKSGSGCAPILDIVGR